MHFHDKEIRLATRKSKLALWQANWVKHAIEQRYSNITVTLIGMVTEGDREQSLPLTDRGGKSNFVKTLQNALLNDEADIAVHSIKDMSVHVVDELTLAAITKREDPRDAFISYQANALSALKPNPIIGTASPRRTSLLKSLRPDAQIQLLRGNVDTRLTKLQQGEYDAIVLAAAGLKRLGLADHIRSYFSPDSFIPAIGQGALAVECRATDLWLQEQLAFLHDHETACCITAEKAVNLRLNGDCYTPIGAHATLINREILLRAMIGSLNGKTLLRAEITGGLNEASALGNAVANDLLAQGAAKLIKAY